MKLNIRLLSIAGLVLAVFLTSYAAAETVYKVRSFDTLNRVVSKFYKKSSYPRAQIMVAILSKNPQAFRNGNINVLLRGKRLTLPSDEEINAISYDEAKILLSQHALGFNSGFANFSAPVDDAKMQKTLTEVKEQTKKITQLKEEGDALRKQLDNLFSQKKKRDQELIDLEKTIQAYAKKEQAPTDGATEAEIAARNKKLKETNEILQRKLSESKSELAENARSTMTLERKLSTLRDRIEKADDVGSDASPDNMAVGSDSATMSEGAGTSLRDKLFWVLPLLLLAAAFFLLWLLFKWLMGRRKQGAVIDDEDDYEKDYAALIDDYESTDYLKPENQVEEDEGELEASIKLDVARAYLEADDTESALNILEEIMKEDDVGLKKEAQEILAQIDTV